MIRVLLFEDNPDFVDSLQELLQAANGIELVAVYNNGNHMVEKCRCRF